MAQTKQAASFTLGIDIIQWLNSTAKQLKISKSKIVEQGIRKLQEARIKKELKESCLRMRNDPETFELANMGMQDFIDMIDKHEQGR